MVGTTASIGLKLYINFGFFTWLPLYDWHWTQGVTVYTRTHRFLWLCFELQLSRDIYGVAHGE